MFTLVIDGKTILYKHENKKYAAFQYFLLKEQGADWGMLFNEETGTILAEFDEDEGIETNGLREPNAVMRQVSELLKSERKKAEETWTARQGQLNAHFCHDIIDDEIQKYLSAAQLEETKNDRSRRIELLRRAVGIELEVDAAEEYYLFLNRLVLKCEDFFGDEP